MTELGENELRAALAAAKDADVRRKYSNLLRKEDLAERSPVLASQRKRYEELLTSLLTSAGHTVEEWEEIRTQHAAEIRRLLQERKATLIEHSSSVKEALRSSVISQRNLSEYFTSLESEQFAPRSYNYVLLDTPALILPPEYFNMESATIKPLNNVAKINGSLDSAYRDIGGDNLTYVFAWRNRSDTNAVVNAGTLLTVNGYSDVFASGPSFWDENVTWVDFNAALSVLGIWADPPITPPNQPGQVNSIAFLEARGGLWFGLGDFESSGISGTYLASYDAFLVPPNKTAVFEVSLSIGIAMVGDGGYIDIDFASGDFEVCCPAVGLTIRT